MAEQLRLKDVQFPLQVRVRTDAWAPAFVLGVVLWVVAVPIILGVPSALYEWGGAKLQALRIFVVVSFPAMCLFQVYTWMAWRRPRHLTVTEDEIRTHSWRVRWKDVHSFWLNIPPLSKNPDKDSQVCFVIEDHAWTNELRRGNRWDSGYPFGSGGLLPRHNVIRTQAATDPPINSLFELFEELWMQAHGENPEDGEKPEDPAAHW
ncbi:hypothetical protein [Brevibacterium sp. Marseille-P9724]|uniref:hypothetical protein n=1 Tax=Brevibacterium sp. Marseille-P9724 TaxID=2614125 RepID=UPI00186653E9|nr:hypothetical protein [Brevibacterium sp. Marseille-P9724]